MNGMFAFTTKFNGNMNGWNVSSVEDMSYMFWYNFLFDGNISDWDVSRVKNMEFMLHHATSFKGDISGWDVGNVKGFQNIFYQASSFTNMGYTLCWDYGRPNSYLIDVSISDTGTDTDIHTTFVARVTDSTCTDPS